MKTKRRTPEEIKKIAELKETVIQKAEKHNITAYELSQNVGMTEVGIRKILNHVTKNPALETLQDIDVYIQTCYENSSVAEGRTAYKTENADLHLILKKLNTIESKIDSTATSINLKIDILFEILKNAKAEELKYIESQLKIKLSPSSEKAQ